MKLLLLKCAICDNWYRPAAHDNHCPVCGSYPLKVYVRSRATVRYYRFPGPMRVLEVVRSIPRSFENSHNCE